MLIARAPVADAESNDAAEQESFVGDRIEDHAERAALIIMPRNIAIEAVTDCREKKDSDGGEPLPILRAAFLNALPIINRQGDENWNHQDPDHGNLVGGCHLKARDHGTLQDCCETLQGKLRRRSAARPSGCIMSSMRGLANSSIMFSEPKFGDSRGARRKRRRHFQAPVQSLLT